MDKFIVIFNDGEELYHSHNLNKAYVFNTIEQAKEFFLNNGIEIWFSETMYNRFLYYTHTYRGGGKMYWAKNIEEIKKDK